MAAFSVDKSSSFEDFFESVSESFFFDLDFPPSSSSSSMIVAPSFLPRIRSSRPPSFLPYISTRSAGISTVGPGAKPSPLSLPRSLSSSTPIPEVMPPKTPSPSSRSGVLPAPDPDAFASMESNTPGARLRARAVSSPDACGTGSKSTRCPTHARCTRKSHSTSESANSASRSARDTASPTTDHSHLSLCSPAGIATVLPIATPKDTDE